MSSHSYFKSDLAWVRHICYSHHAERTGPSVVALPGEGGFALGASVLDVGLWRRLASAPVARRWFCDRPDLGEIHAKAQDDWAIVTRFSRPEPNRFDRARSPCFSGFRTIGMERTAGE